MLGGGGGGYDEINKWYGSTLLHFEYQIIKRGIGYFRISHHDPRQLFIYAGLHYHIIIIYCLLTYAILLG